MSKALYLLKVEAAWLLVGAIMLLAIACLLPTSVDDAPPVQAQNHCFLFEQHDGLWYLTYGDVVWELPGDVDMESVRYTIDVLNDGCVVPTMVDSNRQADSITEPVITEPVVTGTPPWYSPPHITEIPPFEWTQVPATDPWFIQTATSEARSEY